MNEMIGNLCFLPFLTEFACVVGQAQILLAIARFVNRFAFPLLIHEFRTRTERQKCKITDICPIRAQQIVELHPITGRRGNPSDGQAF
ncbi:MAG: hypothetical protein GY927_01840 [bacterium]|nr:hypothetical protein [bacterium]